jgi:hypothetical protein
LALAQRRKTNSSSSFRPTSAVRPPGCIASILARRDAEGVRLYTRNGNDFTKRFPLVVAAVATLPVRSCLIDGEAIVSDESGFAVFEPSPRAVTHSIPACVENGPDCD